MAKTTELADRLTDVKARIENACTKVGRAPNEVMLLAVTKYAGPEQIRELLRLGVADLGESRAQQLAQRAAQINEFHARRLAAGDIDMPAKIRWHMIGHLQRNKIKQVMPIVKMVHSVDSLRLAEDLESHFEKHPNESGKKFPVLLQVNASEESQKFGLSVGAVTHLAEQIDTMNHIQVAGLMCMAKQNATEQEARFVFSRTREIFEEMKFRKIGGTTLRHLSMGMTSDFEWAIMEGSTLVRIGSALFGNAPDQVDEDEE